MLRKCGKLQLRALVGRFGSQNAMVGRLDDLGAGHWLKEIFSIGHFTKQMVNGLDSACHPVIWMLGEGL